jgi:RHS repeat-associated protein
MTWCDSICFSQTFWYGYFGPLLAPEDAGPGCFTGKERDAETGLDYFEARYMSSAQGRFTSPDPLNLSAIFHMNDPQSWNGCSYARNNPLSVTDPTGMVYQVCDTEGQASPPAGLE